MISAIKVIFSASFAILLSMQSSVAEAPMDIVVKQLKENRWQVQFSSAGPVSRLYFVSHALDEASARANYWEPVDPSIEFVRDSGMEYIQRKDGVDFDMVEFTVTTRFTRSIGSQPSFIPFSDGGVLIHDPSFIVWPERPETIIDKTINIVSSFYRLDGFERLSGEGERFSYIGKHKPEKLEGHHVLYDTGLSPHLKLKFDNVLPRVIEYFAARLNSNYDDLVFSISQNDESLDGQSGSRGGVVQNQVFFHFYGDVWRSQEDMDGQWVPMFIAHEMAHVFQDHDKLGMRQSWLTEGSADAMALLATMDLGYWQDVDRSAYLEQAFVECVSAIKQRQLSAEMTADNFRSGYDCGLLMHLAADSALRRASDGAMDLFTLWNEFMEKQQKGTLPDAETYLQLLRGHVPATADFLEKMAKDRIDDPDIVIEKGLADAGLQIFE